MRSNHFSSLFMVTGVARSGTTLLSECLDHHPNLACFPDPINELFRGFIHFAYYKITGQKKSSWYPIDHFFFSGDPRVSQFLDSADLKHEIPEYLRPQLLERISARGGKFCPALKDAVKECRAKRFDELILEILSLLCDKGSAKDCVSIGFKDAWCEQFILPLSKTFPNMKFIHIIRDPRAVISSNFHSKSKYPLFFSVRDWRKSVYYRWKYQLDSPGLREKFFWLKYEDLVEDPEMILGKAASFLKVPPTRDMIASAFQKPNSSYADVKDTQTISYQSKERWKTDCPEGLKVQIEICCLPEMRKMGYNSSPHTVISTLLTIFQQPISYGPLGEWCKKMIPGKILYYTLWQWMNAGIEFLRVCIYRINLKHSPLLTKFFYDSKYYQWLRES